MQKTRAFALLASVPEIDLISRLEAIAAQLDADDLPPDHSPKVAFGRVAFEMFAEAEKLRGGKAIDVFIYAANAKGEQPLNPQVTWQALYIGSVGSRRGRYPGRTIFRPTSTATDRPNWAVFWEVQELGRIKTPISIGSLRGKNKKTTLQPRFIPEEPLLVEYL